VKKLSVRNIGRGSTALMIGLMFLLVFLLHFSQVPSAHPWYWSTHRFVARRAIELMPDSLDWFFSTYSSVIIEYSVKPDQWKGSDPNESYRHWYHVDHPHDESHYWDGVLPWAVEDNFNMFVQYLRENDWDHAAQLAGVISHYIGDASNPLHATSDYTPGGNHGAFESTVDSHLGEMNMDMPGFVPQELENVFDSTMQLLDEGYSCTIVLNPYLEQSILWNDDEIRDMTEERLRASAQLHANIWYTGMVQAGLATILRNVEVTISPSENSAGPGEDVTFRVIVANAGNVADNYNLAVVDSAGWGATLSENLLTIPVGENRAVVVRVTVPSDAVEGDSTTITVTAASRENAQVEDSATCTATNASPPRYLVPLAVGGVVVGGGVAVALLVKKGKIHLPS